MGDTEAVSLAKLMNTRPVTSSFKLVGPEVSVAVINYTQVWKWEWLIGLRRNDSIVNTYIDDDMMIDRLIVACLRVSASALCLNFH